jgi:hypothetical protein
VCIFRYQRGTLRFAAILSILAVIISAAAGQVVVGQKLSPEQLQEQRKQAAAHPRRIIFNNDGNDALTASDAPPLTHEKFLEQRTSPLVGSQVDAIFYCTGVFNFYSHHSTEAEPLKYTTERRREQGWDLGTRGPDTLQTVVDFGHRHGIEVFWSMRMNDTHDSYTPHLLCQWKKDHPEWLMAKKRDKRIRSGSGRWSAVNYAVPEVREKVLRILTDVAARYDVEGLELDFFRHPIYFQPQLFGQPVTQQQRDLLTDLMRSVRKMADRRAADRGRPLLIAVRVPDSPEYCSSIGIDLLRWLKEDLVDLLIVGGYFQLNSWETSVALGHKYGVPVYPSLDEPRFKDKEALELRNSVACYRGRAREAWAAGADGIYLFNVFDPRNPLLKELGDPKTLAGLDHLYTSGAREQASAKGWLAGGTKFANLPPPLPERPVTLEPGKTTTVELRAVPPPAGSSLKAPKITLRLRFKDRPVPSEAIAVKFNGRLLGQGTHEGRWIDYAVDQDRVTKGVNHVEITLGAASTKKLVLQDAVLLLRVQKR